MQISAFLITLCIILIFKPENLMQIHLIHFYPVHLGCLVLREQNIHALLCNGKARQCLPCKTRWIQAQKSTVKACIFHYTFSRSSYRWHLPNQLQIKFFRESLIMLIKAGGVFFWRIWVTHIFHDSGGQLMCLSSLPSIETSSERVAAAPPPFLETAACWEKDGEREQGKKGRQ